MPTGQEHYKIDNLADEIAATTDRLKRLEAVVFDMLTESLSQFFNDEQVEKLARSIEDGPEEPDTDASTREPVRPETRDTDTDPSDRRPSRYVHGLDDLTTRLEALEIKVADVINHLGDEIAQKLARKIDDEQVEKLARSIEDGPEEPDTDASTREPARPATRDTDASTRPAADIFIDAVKSSNLADTLANCAGLQLRDARRLLFDDGSQAIVGRASETEIKLIPITKGASVLSIRNQQMPWERPTK